MAQSPPNYWGIVSARSRRLRTIGVMLLLAALLLSAYGAMVLMPAINRAVTARHARIETAPHASISLTARSDEMRALTRDQKAEKVQVATVFAFWGVCALLVIGALFVAWLDLREITRNYVQQRKQLWTQTAERVGREAGTDGSGGQAQS